MNPRMHTIGERSIAFRMETKRMTDLKKSLFTTARWSWFGLLVLTAFGYLIAGLSDSADRLASDQPAESVPIRTASIDSASAEAAVSESATSQTTLPDASPSEVAGTVSVSETVAHLDQLRGQTLASQGLESAPMADWMTVCRRMSLSLVGSGMSLEEIRNLEQYPQQERESIHLENLLNDSRFHHYWGERWTRFLVGTDVGQFIVYRRRRFRIWLSETFADNWSYDRLVRTLITSKGLWTDKPEVNFLTSTYDSNDNSPDPIRLAARTSRAFLGLRIDCLQCHDDFLGNVSLGDIEATRGGLQTDFHQLAAFFTSAKSNGLQGVRDGDVDYKYQYLNENEEVAVEAKVPYQSELLPAEGDARDRLAAWITAPQNHQAALAAVSHVWALMYGRPIGESVDNLPLDHEQPEVLHALARDFVKYGYDMRRLIRCIALSESFRVDSRADFEINEEHEQYGAAFPLVRLRPEQVAGSVIQAARVKTTDRESSLFLQFSTLTGNNDFVKRYGDIGEDEFETDSITITQRLLMMNGSLVQDLVKENPFLNVTSHVGMFAKDDAAAVETMYLCTLNRYPTDEESQHFAARVANAENRGRAIEDVMWVLVNSSEMAWNH